MSQMPPSMSNVQLELLKMFSYNLPEDELQELKQTLVKFFAQKIRKQADAVWHERGYSSQTMVDWLNENEQ